MSSTIKKSSRRTFLGNASAAGVASIGGAVLGACGGASDTAVAQAVRSTINSVAIPSGKTTRVDSGGVKISIHEYGYPAGKSVLFIHGWSQCYMSWYRQFTDSGLASKYRLIAMDVRGHGESDKPLPPLDSSGLSPAYTAASHAGDVAQVISALGLIKPVLVGWSFGGLVMMDYLAVEGFSNVGGVIFVDSNMASSSAPSAPNYFGPGVLDYFADLLSSDLTKSAAATLNFLKAVPQSPFSVDDLALALAYNMTMPSGARSAIFARAKDDYDTLLMPRMKAAALKTLVISGDSDTVILPAAADAIASLTGGQKIVYTSVGHAPFLEATAKFNQDIANFVG